MGTAAGHPPTFISKNKIKIIKNSQSKHFPFLKLLSRLQFENLPTVRVLFLLLKLSYVSFSKMAESGDVSSGPNEAKYSAAG